MDATWGACRRRVRGRWTSRQPLAIELCVPVPMRQPEYRNEARHAPTHDRLRRTPRLHCTRPGFHDERMEDASVRVRARERQLRSTRRGLSELRGESHGGAKIRLAHAAGAIP